MTIDEVIDNFNRKAKGYKEDYANCKEREIYTCKDCTNCFTKTCEELEKEYNQLAEWLEELKDYRDKNKLVVKVDVENLEEVKQMIEEMETVIYNKAIDDFAEFMNTRPIYENWDSEIIPMPFDMAAEKLKKEGGKK